MDKKAALSICRAALITGCFFGWLLSVFHISVTMTGEANTQLKLSIIDTFLTSLLIILAATSAALLLHDPERLFTHKLMKWIPGVLLAEVALAMPFVTEKNHLFFSVLAAVAASLGILSVLTALLRIDIRNRMQSCSLGLALGTLIYFITTLICRSFASAMAAASVCAVLSVLFVRPCAYSGNKTKMRNITDIQGIKILIRHVPFSFIPFTLFFTAFMIFAPIFPGVFSDTFTVGNGLIVTAFITLLAIFIAIAFITRAYSMPNVFAAACALTAAGGYTLSVEALTSIEATMFTLFFYCGIACFASGILVFTVTFAHSRPHPLFFSLLGFTAFVLACVLAIKTTPHVPAESEDITRLSIAQFILAPVALIIMMLSFIRNKYTENDLQHQRLLKQRIQKLAGIFSLSIREKRVLELIIVDNCSYDELLYRLYVSRSSIDNCINSIKRKSLMNIEQITAAINAVDKELDEVIDTQLPEKNITIEKRTKKQSPPKENSKSAAELSSLSGYLTFELVKKGCVTAQDDAHTEIDV